MIDKKNKVFLEDAFRLDTNGIDPIQKLQDKINKACADFCEDSIWNFLQTKLGYKTKEDAIKDWGKISKRYFFVSDLQLRKSPVDESKLEIEYTLCVKKYYNGNYTTECKYTLIAEEDRLGVEE